LTVAGDGVATRRRLTCLITLNYPRLRCLHCLRLLVGPCEREPDNQLFYWFLLRNYEAGMREV